MPAVPRRSLPSLGSRGEGWVLLQVLLVAGVLLSAFAGSSRHGTFGTVARVVGPLLLAIGVWMLVAGAARLGRALTPLPAPKNRSSVVTTGIYRLVRHPMYGGGILAALGWAILFATLPGLIVTVVLAVFLDLKSRREEQWLVDELPGYDAYLRATPRRLIPFVY